MSANTDLTVAELLDDPEIASARYERKLADYPLVDGDVVGARITGLSRSDLTLHGRKHVEEDNTHDPFVGPSRRYIRAAMAWLDDDRFVGAGRSNWVEWDSLVLCESCFESLDATNETCPECGGQGTHPCTPAVMHFEETLDFPEEHVGADTTEELFAAIEATLSKRY